MALVVAGGSAMIGMRGFVFRRKSVKSWNSFKKS
jgi:hypothetical protein